MAEVHVLRLERVETKKGNQGPSEGYYLPTCSCGWKADVGVSWWVTEGAAAVAWRLAYEHARVESKTF